MINIKALMTPDANGLLPCDYCWTAPHRDAAGDSHEGDECQFIRCLNNKCKVQPLILQSQEEYGEWDLVEEWNDRAYIPALQELLAVVRKQHEALKRCRTYQIADELDRIIDPAVKLAAPYLEE